MACAWARFIKGGLGEFDLPVVVVGREEVDAVDVVGGAIVHVVVGGDVGGRDCGRLCCSLAWDGFVVVGACLAVSGGHVGTE